MRITFFPKTRLGKWTVGLFTAFVILVLIGTMFPGLERNSDLPDIINNPLYAALMYSGLGLAISAAFIGLISIIKYKERSVLVYLSLPFGIIYFCGSIVMIAGLIGKYFS